MVKWSNTSLGKLLIISIVLFYASIDKLYGILVCLLFILFYQSDTVENMLNKDGFEGVNDTTKLSPIDFSNNIQPTDNLQSIIDESVKLLNNDSSQNQSNENSKVEFRKTYCKKGHLVNKCQKVKIDMTEHVFPGVEFPDEKCNLCDPTCNFSVTESQINTLNSEGFKCVSARE